MGIVLAPDPRRWYLRVAYTGGAGSAPGFGPLGDQLSGGVLPAMANPTEYKFRDAPGLTTGGFVAQAGAGFFLHFYEELFTGG